MLQWAKDAYDDFVSWVPQAYWRHPLVLLGLLECCGAARDSWKAQSLFQQLLMQARLSTGGAEAAGGGEGRGGDSSTVGVGAGAGGSGTAIGMARTTQGSGRSRRARAAGGGFGGPSGEGGVNAATAASVAASMDPSAFDAKARNIRNAMARSNVAFGIHNRRRSSSASAGAGNSNNSSGRNAAVLLSGGRSGGAVVRRSYQYSEIGLRSSGVLSPSLLGPFLNSFSDPFLAFSALEAHFLFNMRPSMETVHVLMARLLLDHAEVRADNTLVTIPNVDHQRRVLFNQQQREKERAAKQRLLGSSSSAEAAAAMDALIDDGVRRVPLFATLAEQQKAIAEMNRAEEEASLRLLIATLDAHVGAGAAEGADDGSDMLSSADGKKNKKAVELSGLNLRHTAALRRQQREEDERRGGTASSPNAALFSLLREGIADRAEYLYERQGHASDLLFSLFYLTQKGNKDAIKAQGAKGFGKNSSGGDSNNTNNGISTSRGGTGAALANSLRYFTEGPTPDGTTVSLALLQVLKNYAADVEAVCFENAQTASAPLETMSSSSPSSAVSSPSLISAALLSSPRLAVVSNNSSTADYHSASSSSKRGGDADRRPHPIVQHIFGGGTHQSSASASSVDSSSSSSSSRRLTALEAAPTLAVATALCEEAIEAALRLLCDGYYPLWAVMGGADSSAALPRRLRQRAAAEAVEAAAALRDRTIAREAAAQWRREKEKRRFEAARASSASDASSLLTSASLSSSSLPLPSAASVLSAANTATIRQTILAEEGVLLGSDGVSSSSSSSSSDAASGGISEKSNANGSSARPLRQPVTVSETIVPALPSLGMAVLGELLVHYRSLLSLQRSEEASASAVPISDANPLFPQSAFSGASASSAASSPSLLLPYDHLSEAAQTLLWTVAAMRVPTAQFAALEAVPPALLPATNSFLEHANTKAKKSATTPVAYQPSAASSQQQQQQNKKKVFPARPASQTVTEFLLAAHLLTPHPPASPFGGVGTVLNSASSVGASSSSAASAAISPPALQDAIAAALGAVAEADRAAAAADALSSSAATFASASGLSSAAAAAAIAALDDANASTTTGPTANVFLFGNQHQSRGTKGLSEFRRNIVAVEGM